MASTLHSKSWDVPKSAFAWPFLPIAAGSAHIKRSETTMIETRPHVLNHHYEFVRMIQDMRTHLDIEAMGLPSS